MADQPTSLVTVPDGYREWLESLKKQIHTARQRAARSVNTEMLRVYWQIGRDILDRQHDQGWGTRIVDRVSHDLRHAFPGLGGFSRANLMYMRSFADAWELDAIVQQPVGQLPALRR